MSTEPTSIEFWCQHAGKHPAIGDVWHRLSVAHGKEEERYSRYLCAALSMMAHDATDCDTMIHLLDSVASGSSVSEEFGLNDTCVTFRPHGVQVEILIEEQPQPIAGRFSLSEYRKALCAWREFLLMPEAIESRMRLELP
jgi:hypothetical protein